MKSTLALLFVLISSTTFAKDVCFLKVNYKTRMFSLSEDILFDKGYQLLDDVQEVQEGDYTLDVTEEREIIYRSYTYRGACVTWEGPGAWSERNCTKTGRKPYSIRHTFTLKTSKVQSGRNTTMDVLKTNFTRKIDDYNYDKYNKLLTKALTKCRSLD